MDDEAVVAIFNQWQEEQQPVVRTCGCFRCVPAVEYFSEEWENDVDQDV